MGCPSIEYLLTGQTGSYYMSNTPLNINTWYHLVFISSGLQMSIYVNNVLIGTYTGNYMPQNVFEQVIKLVEVMLLFKMTLRLLLMILDYMIEQLLLKK
jgi:hypothetical protein